MEKSSIAKHTGGGGNEPQGRQGKPPIDVENNLTCHPELTFSLAQRKSKQKESETGCLSKLLCHPEFISGSYYRNITTSPENIKNIPSASHAAKRHVRGGCATPQKAAFTLAEFFSPFYLSPRRVAFTLAEVLITLGIIGIVAAITLPTLINKYQKNVATTKLKKLYSVFMNANQRAVEDFGPSEYWDYPMTDENHNPIGITIDEFFEKYYAHYLNVSEVKKRNLVNYKVTNYNGVDAGYNNNAISIGNMFRMNDGSCISMWANEQFFVFTADINCESLPNVIGKDVFDLFELYWFGPKKLTVPWIRFDNLNITRESAIDNCKRSSFVDGTPDRCFSLFVHDGWQFKDDYPW